MTDNTLIDTSILVYAFDTSEPKKRQICKRLIETSFEEGAFITNQILAELYTVLTSKIRQPIPQEDAEHIVTGFVHSPQWRKLAYSSSTLLMAMTLSRRYRVDFWDCLIAATMIENNILTIVTENERDFTKIPTLKVVNPLKD